MNHNFNSQKSLYPLYRKNHFEAICLHCIDGFEFSSEKEENKYPVHIIGTGYGS